MKRNRLPAILLLIALCVPLLAGCVKKNQTTDGETAAIESIADLKGKKVGIMLGSSNDADAEKYLPECDLEYYNTLSDLAVALDNDKITAYIDEESTARIFLQDYPNFRVLDSFSACDYAVMFPKNERGQALCKQMNTFLAQCEQDGTMDAIDALWYGEDESKQVIDLSLLTGENGTLHMAVSSAVGRPAAYLKDGAYVGYDVDVVYHFCKAYGYAMEIQDYDFSGLLAAVSSGKVDLAASGITVTEERRESAIFSDAIYNSSVLVIVKDAEKSEVTAADIAGQFAGKKIGVVAGSVFDQIVLEQIPDCELEYYNSNADLTAALDSGKISAYAADEPVARCIAKEHSDQKICATLVETPYAYIFPKDNPKSDRIREQINEFLTQIRADGTLKEIDDIWFGGDESLHKVDYASLTGENGTVTFATCTDVGIPFSYLKDGEYIGYDLDIAARFCKAYGYQINVVDTNVSGLLTGVSTGRFDFGAASVAVTEERKESMNFSDADYDGSIVLVTKETGAESGYASYSGARIGVMSGTICDTFAEENIPGCVVQTYNSNSDLVAALENGKIDVYLTDEPIARALTANNSECISDVLKRMDYAYIFPKGTAKSEELIGQMNAFLAKIREDGTLQKIDDTWFGNDENAKKVDFDDLTEENGVLNFAISSNIGEPFCYIKDNQYAGYDVDIAVRFCREYGYGIQISDSDFNGLLAAIASGRCDFGAGCITITEEREDSADFSEPNYCGGIVAVSAGEKQEENQSGAASFLLNLKDSFTKTFVREKRYQLFVSGLATTAVITALSTVFGTALGFGIFLLYRKRFGIFNGIVNVWMDILQKTPVVLILMILFYLVFNQSMLDGVWVSVISFTMLFAAAVIALLKTAVNAVDKGQMEAALALGYTDTKAFVRVILPQALRHFLPGYMGEIVSLIKGTAIVGYIAVQDLTKVSDIIRSRTYEAFFPLIASAAIYYAYAWLMTLLVMRIQRRIDPKRRSRAAVLKGVKRDD